MSSRTLTRRLAEDGLTYKGLLDDVRRKLALQYLKDRRIGLKKVAYLLGYSGVSAFYDAFHRWTGSSPGWILKSSATPEVFEEGFGGCFVAETFSGG